MSPLFSRICHSIISRNWNGVFRFERYADKQQQFLSFVLDRYITQGVGELDQEKLPDLLALKYHSVGDAVAELGSVAEIRDVFVGFQEHLYLPISSV